MLKIRGVSEVSVVGAAEDQAVVMPPCGMVVRIVGALKTMEQTEQLFVSGLLHDIGKLMALKYYCEHAVAYLRMAAEFGNSVFRTEHSVIEMNHTQISLYLLRKWRLPLDLENNIAFHQAHGKSSDPIKAGPTNHLLACAQGGKYMASIVSIKNLFVDVEPAIRRSIRSSVQLNFELADDAIADEGNIHFYGYPINSSVLDKEFRNELIPDDYVCLNIPDTGRSMDKNTVRRIFQPFLCQI